MNYIELSKLIQSITPAFTENDFMKPFKETTIDSLDLITIRVSIEKEIKSKISNEQWFEFESVNDILQYLLQKENF